MEQDMIRRLQRKMIFSIMLVSSIMLTGILAGVYYSSTANYKNQTAGTLRSAINAVYAGKNDAAPSNVSSSPEENPQKPNPLPRRNDKMTPVLVTEYDRSGTFSILTNRLAGIDEASAKVLTDAAAAAGTSEGLLDGSSYRFLSQPQPHHAMRYAFTDVYVQQQALRIQLLWSAGLGTAALLILFIAARCFAIRAVHPIADAWERQRQFISDASHELKTPLSVILANTALLKKNDSLQNSAKDLRRLSFIEEEGVRMKRLIENLLQLARSDAGYQAEHQPVDFSFLVKQRISVFEPIAYESGKNLIFKHMPENQLLINGNESQLIQLVDILLDNACKYGAPGTEIEASLSVATRHGSGGKQILFSVSSKGEPLHPDSCMRIFERFYREDESRGRIPGYGLGLSLAKSITQNHRGSISAASDGIDTNTFSFRLPLLRP